MSHPSPHRVRPRFRAPLLGAVLAAGALLLSAGPHFAVSSDPQLPGSVPKAPPTVLGFPRWFPQTVDFRPREGAVVAADSACVSTNWEPGGAAGEEGSLAATDEVRGAAMRLATRETLAIAR